MKTSKQLSEEIFQKIQEKEETKARVQKNVRHAFVFTALFGILIPTAVIYATNENFNHEKPLSYPSVKEETPFDPDESNDPMLFYGGNGQTFSLVF